jgi:ankyrin repeat protein
MHSDSESTTFETSRSWTNHLQNAHGCTWECRAPSHAPLTFDQESQFKDHSHTEHGVPTRHVDTLSNAARKPVVEKVLECPFGDDFHFEGPLESSSVFSSDALQLHVAAHLKEIALLALQKIPDEAEQSGINLASDQQSEDDGLGVAHVRGSMYSVLDDENLDPENEAQEEMMDHNADTITPSVERLDLEDRDPNHQWKFHEAARTGNISAIRSLMVHGDGFIMDRPDATGLTPYLWAVLAGHAHVAEVLLDRGVEVDSTGGSSKSALGWAANVGHASVAELLVRKGSSLDLVSRDLHRAPLAEAAACGNPGLTEMLLTTDGVDPDQKDKDGWSAVHLAAEQSHFEVVRMLLATGRVDVNAVSSYGTSSLHCAANGGNIDIVRLLLDHGADPLKTTCHGWTPVHHACFLGHSNIVQLLLEDVRVRSSLPSVDNHGWSVLHLAAYSRDQATLETLLQVYDLTSSLDVCDESGLTAADWLDLAPMSHSYKATSNLAFTKSRCCRAVTGLRQAVVEGNVSMVELLLDQGCSINGTDSGGRTALYHAVRKAHTSIMSLLLAKGADPNVLPAGRRNWEGCVTDDILLMRLKQSGYHNSSTDRDVDSQMRMRLRRQCGVVNGPDTVMEDTTVRVRRTTELSTASSVKPAPPSSFRSKLWKRIRGQ